MPEAPDVEVAKRYLQRTSLHREITQVSVRDPSILADSLNVSDLKKSLIGNQFSSVRRHGKYLFIQLGKGRWLVIHLGMTGWFHFYKRKNEQPEFTKMRIDFATGERLALVMPRKLGFISLAAAPADLVAEKNLGPDFMSEGLTMADFLKKMEKKGGMVKSALMDQSFVSGLGNVYVDEILYQSRIYPRAQMSALDEEDFKRIFSKGREIIQQAIDEQADVKNLPADWLIKRRHAGDACPGCTGQVQRITVSGRSGYYCPACQTRGK